jgi:hypothetical protein
MLNWAEPGTKACPNNPDTTVLAYNRPILLRYDGDKIILEDIYVWPVLEFELDENNQFSYSRDVTLQDSSTLSFHYVFKKISADHIEGNSTATLAMISRWNSGSPVLPVWSAHGKARICVPAPARNLTARER